MKKNALLTLIAVAFMILTMGCGNNDEKQKNAAPMSVRSEVGILRHVRKKWCIRRIFRGQYSVHFVGNRTKITVIRI